MFCLGATALAQPANGPAPSPAAVQEFSGAVALQNRGEYEIAADAWSDFLKQRANDPLAAKARHYRGVCRFQLKRYADAKTDFEHVIKSSPVKDGPNDNLIESTYVNLGLSLFNMAQAGGDDSAANYDRSIIAFKTQLEKAPNGEFAPMARYYQAEALYAREKLPAAIVAYEGFVAKHPKHALRPNALYGLGVAQAEAENVAAACKQFAVFLAAFPKHALAPETTMRLGDALFAQGKHAEAEPRFATAGAANGFEHADYALLRQAACRFEVGNFAGAAKLYAALVERFPKSPHASVAAMNAGKALMRTGDHDKAIGWFKNAHAAGGADTAESAHWLARAQLAANKPADALTTSEAALNAQPPKTWQIPLAFDRADALYAIPARRAESIVVYTKIADDHKSSPRAGQALYLAADTALAVRDYNQALALANRCLGEYPKHDNQSRVRHIASEARLQLKKYDAATAGFRKLIEDFPKDSNLAAWRNRLALALSLSGKYQETIDLLALQIGKIENAATRAEAELLVGAAHLAKKEYGKAVSLLQAAVDRAGEAKNASLVERALLKLARAQHGVGKTDAAIVSTERLLAEYPDSSLALETRLRLAEFHAALGNDDRAAETYEQVLAAGQNGPLAPSALLGAAGAFSRTGNYPKAIGLLDRFLSKYTDHLLRPDALFARAVARQKNKNDAGAIEDVAAFLAARSNDPRTNDALYVRGLSEANQEKHAEAAKTFEAILAADAEYATADRVLYELAWARRESGDEAGAVKTFERLTTEHADSPLAAECHYRIGEAKYAARDYVGAARSYKIARDKMAKDGGGKGKLAEKSRHKLAWSFYQQGNYDTAEKEFAAQLAATPDGPLSADAKVMRGESFFKQKKYAKTLAAMQEAIQAKPSSDVFRVIALLHAGQAAGQLEKWDESLSLLDRAAKDFPENNYRNEIDYERAWTMHHLGRDDDALPLFKKVASRDAAVLGARSRFMVGEIEMAKKHYSSAVRAFFQVAYGYDNVGEEVDTWKINAMFDAARCLEQLKKQSSAVKLYRELVEKYPKSEKSEHAKNRLKEIGN